MQRKKYQCKYQTMLHFICICSYFFTFLQYSQFYWHICLSRAYIFWLTLCCCMCIQDEPVKGVMLVTPDFVMFDPDECKQSNMSSLHSVTASMSEVLSVSMYHNAAALRHRCALSLYTPNLKSYVQNPKSSHIKSQILTLNPNLRSFKIPRLQIF